MAIDLEKATQVWTLPWDADWVTGVAFVGRTVVAGNNRGELLAWALPDKAGGAEPLPSLRLVGHSNVISRLIALRDGRTLLSCSYDHSIRVWDLQASPGAEETVDLNAQNRADLKRRNASKIPLAIEAKVRTIPSVRALEGHRDWISGMSLSADEKVLLSGDDKGQVIVWDVPGGKEIRRWSLPAWAYAVALSPDGNQALVSERRPLVFDSGRHAGVKIWDVRKGTVQHDLSEMFKGQHLAAAAFSPDGKTLAVLRGGEVDGNNGKVTLVDPATGKKLRESATGHLNGGTDLAFLQDGQHLLSAGRDTTIRAWAVADGKQVKELSKARGGQFKDWVHALALTPDGQWLAAADMAGAVQIWSLA